MSEEEWVTAAIIDDTIVAALLLRLKQVASYPLKWTKPVSRIQWSVRQRRSKSLSVNTKNPAAPTTSPTTPLSWSGGGTVDGDCEESSRPPSPSKLTSNTRSKANGTNETTNSKRSRRKKTLAELKEEEILLIKERTKLKTELALLRANLENQRDTNQNLKKMKIDLQQKQINERGTSTKSIAYDGISGQYKINVSLLSPSPEICCPKEVEAHQESKLLLPDLNLPFDAEILCGAT